ncbi:uncharacterized protein LOC143451757 [Clavelina lepadiformis]|uniref:uncharacterized protein LOC143451757 n=1 Tax=Clavelina lepadiformis TaxID=159417 RepID=UPI0040412558
MAVVSKRKTASAKKSSHGHNPVKQKKQEVTSPKSRKKIKTISDVPKLDQAQRQNNIRQKLVMGVMFYLTVGIAVLYWRGTTQLPEIPQDLQSKMSQSYGQDNEKVNLSQKYNNDSSQNTENITNQPENESNRHIEETTEDENAILDFIPTIQKDFKFLPYPAEPGNPARKWKEIKYKKHKNTASVRVYIMDNFLSSRECDGLMRAHENHVREHNKQAPIICFSGLVTMRLYLKQAKVSWADKVSESDFTPGTRCLNQSLSSQLNGRLVWSRSTSFYPGESKFSSQYEERVGHYAGLKPQNGGKFQVTSYGQGVGYKLHTDCKEHNTDRRDRFATILVYLQDVQSGGETEFTELDIKVKPKKGRALVWNNMDANGNCDLTSYHQAATVQKGKKYILQRWYYYENFPTLGKRTWEPEIPTRTFGLTPRVMCDRFDSGSCRWYDEWNHDHLTNYRVPGN